MPSRYELSAEQWRKIEPLVSGKVTDRGRTATDNRLFVNGCLWIIRSSAMWHHLPERYGPWKRTYNRFRRWAHAGLGAGVCGDAYRQEEPLPEIDSSIVRAHQLSATGAAYCARHRTHDADQPAHLLAHQPLPKAVTLRYHQHQETP